MTKFLVRLFIKDHENTVSPRVRERYGVLSAVVGIICNLSLTVVKLILGVMANSIAITADALNNLSDVGSCLVSLVGFKVSSKPADRDHPFGHARAEYISGLGIAIMILVVGVELIKTSFDKILNPSPVKFDMIVIILLTASIGLKLWMSTFNRSLSKIIDSSAMSATSFDSLSDVLATSVTMVAVVSARFTSFPVDGVMGLIVALLILWGGYKVAMETVSPLLGKAPDPVVVKAIVKALLSYSGIIGAHDLVIHDYGPGRTFASVHAEVPSNGDMMAFHDIIDLAERELGSIFHMQIVIHMDPIETDSEKTNAMRAMTEKIVKGISPDFSMHDFRMVSGPHHTNLIFDVCVGVDIKLTESEIKDLIQNAVSKIDPLYYTVITVDRNYA